MQNHATTTTLLGLCGFRCSGKSYARYVLSEDFALPVFDTDSVDTGAPDADTISAEEVLTRYGRGESYFHFLAPHLHQAIERTNGLLVVDSMKTEADRAVVQSYFPSVLIRVLWIHSSFNVRKRRYTERDVATGRRSESLEGHDATLVRLGVLRLAADADYVIGNVFGADAFKSDVARIMAHMKSTYG